MKPERWRQVDQLFHSALEREPEERAAFLDQACGGDAELRREVESLLAAEAEAESTTKALPAQIAAELLADKQPQEVIGQQLSHYRILAPLGKGGMGEVFLAQDISLNRQVALKLLPSSSRRMPSASTVLSAKRALLRRLTIRISSRFTKSARLRQKLAKRTSSSPNTFRGRPCASR